VDQPEFPLLGEPVGVELVNTLYGLGRDRIDFLRDPRHAVAWAAQVAGSAQIDDVVLLRELRDAARSLFAASANGQALSPRAIATVNRHAQAGCASVVLRLDKTGRAASQVVFRGDAALRARLATSCVEVLTGPSPIARCEGEGCSLFFVQQHGRRRFCHESCSHRARQKRYRRTES
jgi:predicted RNA-binding Zn ribbon-like protein